MADDCKTKKIKPGSIWTADNLKVMRRIESRSIDLIVTDPPFNSKRIYNDVFGDRAGAVAFEDTWTMDNRRRAERLELDTKHPAALKFIEAMEDLHGPKLAAYLTFMAIRMIEMWRILSDRGSLFLHCDDSADAHLSVLLTMIAGESAKRNSIIWKRSTNGNNAKKRLPRVADTILFFAKPGAEFDPPRTQLSEAEIAKRYVYDDGDGKGVYRLDNLAAPSSVGGYHYEYRGYSCPANGWRCPQTTMDQYHEDGLLDYPMTKDGEPAFSKRIQKKRWLSESEGVPIGSIWDDIPSVQKGGSLYPTQKPVRLLARIIEAASVGDQEGGKTALVFDPFCGSGSTLIAAAQTGRRWIGCDISPVAKRVIEERMADEGMIFDLDVHSSDTLPPPRKDVDHPEMTDAWRDRAKRILLKRDGKRCRICWEKLRERDLEVDHKISKARGGGHELENLQLLCSNCNRAKGQKSTTEHMLDLREKNPDEYVRIMTAKARWEDKQKRKRKAGR